MTCDFASRRHAVLMAESVQNHVLKLLGLRGLTVQNSYTDWDAVWYANSCRFKVSCL